MYIVCMVTSCDLPCGDLSECTTVTSLRHSDVEIIGSGNVRLYPLDIFPTYIMQFSSTYYVDTVVEMESSFEM